MKRKPGQQRTGRQTAEMACAALVPVHRFRKRGLTSAGLAIILRAMNIEPSVITRLVKSEDLNHHRTLFAGRAASWLVEASFLAAARATGQPGRVVCLQLHGMTFLKPARLGDILEIRSKVAHLGQKSITVSTECRRDGQPEPLLLTFATFVLLGDHDDHAVPHGLTLDEAYIAANRQLHEQAAALRARRG